MGRQRPWARKQGLLSRPPPPWHPEDTLPRCRLSVCVPVTNINDALLRGISMLNKAREEYRVPERSTSIVIMLTDGDANVGEAAGVIRAAAPGSVAGVLQDLGQLSPGSPMVCEPLNGRALSPCQAFPHLPLQGLVAMTPPTLHV